MKPRPELIASVVDALLEERTATFEVRNQAATQVVLSAQGALRQRLFEVGDSGDIDTILDAERQILENEREYFANSAVMVTSLENALVELRAAVDVLPLVRDAEAYKAVDHNFSLPRNRVGQLPRDQARQFFASQNSRLVNLDKSRLSEAEKRVLKSRKENIATARKLYEGLQRKALGIAIQ